MKEIRITGLSIMMIFILVSCGTKTQQETAVQDNFKSNHGAAGIMDDVSKKNILQIALSSPDHTTLVAGVEAAQLENVLVNAGPLTVFAPTNAAFDKLPAGTLKSLLKPENKNKLANIITFHASPGTFDLDQLHDGMKLYMATGHYVDVKVTDEGIFVNGSKILATIDATNGVVHVIDDVFLPPS